MTKKPRRNTPITAIFCFIFICSLDTIATGRAMMAASEKMLTVRMYGQLSYKVDA